MREPRRTDSRSVGAMAPSRLCGGAIKAAPNKSPVYLSPPASRPAPPLLQSSSNRSLDVNIRILTKRRRGRRHRLLVPWCKSTQRHAATRFPSCPSTASGMSSGF
jgi:hypothetical protein